MSFCSNINTAAVVSALADVGKGIRATARIPISSLSLGWLALPLAPLTSSAEQPVSFKADLAPILLNQCQSCHGPKKVKGDYRVDTYRRALEAGFDELHYRISTDDEDDIMPPDADPLSPEQIALFARWQEEGAIFDGKSPDASLAEIIPGRQHPDPPQTYPRAIPITALSFSEDGNLIYANGYREVTVWSVSDGSLQRRIKGLPERIQSIRIQSQSNQLVVAGGSPGRFGEVRVVNLSDGSLESILHKSDDLCLSAKFNPTGTQLATCGTDGSVRVYRSSDWSEVVTFANHSNWVNDIAWSADGKKLASGSKDRTAKVFDVTNKKRISSYTGHDGSVYTVMFDPKGERVFSGSGDGKVSAWKAIEGTTIKELLNQEAPIFRLVDPGSNQSLILAGGMKSLITIDQNDGSTGIEYPGHGSHLSLAISGDHNLIATGDAKGNIRLFEIESGQELASFSAIPN